jgi:hypothetical protein
MPTRPPIKRTAATLRERFDAARFQFQFAFRSAVNIARRCKALLWHRIYFIRYHVLRWSLRLRAPIAAILLLILILLGAVLVPAIQNVTEPFFATHDRLSVLRNLLVTLGGALIGALQSPFQ